MDFTGPRRRPKGQETKIARFSSCRRRIVKRPVRDLPDPPFWIVGVRGWPFAAAAFDRAFGRFWGLYSSLIGFRCAVPAGHPSVRVRDHAAAGVWGNDPPWQQALWLGEVAPVPGARLAGRGLVSIRL